MKTSDVLNKAADLIEERGWARADGALNNPWGKGGGNVPICIEGGIMAAAGVAFSFEIPKCPAYRAVWDYLQGDKRWGVFRSRLYDWNDTEGRSADEVIATLRAVAVIEAAREEAAEPVAHTVPA